MSVIPLAKTNLISLAVVENHYQQNVAYNILLEYIPEQLENSYGYCMLSQVKNK